MTVLTSSCHLRRKKTTYFWICIYVRTSWKRWRMYFLKLTNPIHWTEFLRIYVSFSAKSNINSLVKMVLRVVSRVYEEMVLEPKP